MADGKANVADEPTRTGAEKPNADWLNGYEASTPESAVDSHYPGDDKTRAVGSLATAYKAHWKGKPEAFPFGSNSQGGK